MDDDLTATLTFQEKLIRKHTPEPLGGHRVVVLERKGEEGDGHYTVLEPGDEGPRQGMIAKLLGKPTVYFAFAVDASKNRLLTFTEKVKMAERGRELELRFGLWYKVTDPELLVSLRGIDPLDRVRKRVAQVVTAEVAQLRWTDVWESFRAESDKVVSDTLHDLRSFARDYGIGIDELHLREEFTEETLKAEKEAQATEAQVRAGQARIDAAHQLNERRKALRRGTAVQDDQDRADADRRRVREAAVDKLVDFIRGAGNAIDLAQLQDLLVQGGLAPFLGGGSPHGAGVIGPGQTPPALAAPGDELSPVLSEMVGLTERFGILSQRRKLRGDLLHLLAAAVADDTGKVAPEEYGWARSARATIATVQLPLAQAEALRNLADPNQLRGRFAP